MGQVSVKLLPQEGAEFDYFGEQVAIDGDYAIVGSWLDDNTNGQDAGAARIFHRVGATWVEQAILLASDGEAGDQFGYSVAINGDIALVGAHRDDNANGALAGAVYVFERSGSSWSEQGKILAADGVFDDQFGASIASAGERLIVGAPGVNERRGAAYVYHLAGGDWLFVDQVVASDGEPGNGFGHAVDIDGNYGLVGAESNDGGGVSGAGTVYMIGFNGSNWIEQQKVTSDFPVLDGLFGYALAIHGGLALIGAPGELLSNVEEAGAAYVFQRSGDVWAQSDKLTALDIEAGDAFGFSVALEGEYLVVGARWDRNNQGEKSGAAYVFRRDGGFWDSEARLLAGDGEIGDQFGNAVGISDEQVIVGARWDDNDGGKDAGAAYVFPIGGSGVPSLLTSESTIDFGVVSVGENTDRNFQIINIGTADLNVLNVSIEGGDAPNFRFVQGGNSVVLAPLAEVNAIVEFAPLSSGLKEATVRIESNGPESPQFLTITGEGADGFQPGIAKVIAERGAVESYFGSTVSVEGDFAIVGAEGQRETEPGAAYIFKRAGNTWIQEARISSLDGEPGDRFGSAVDISATHAIVGAWNDDEARGAAYIFVKSGSAWIQQARIEASDREIDDRFGKAVSIEGSNAIVGAWQDDNIRGEGAGAAYVFGLDGNTWQQQFKLLASDGQQGDRFGSAVAIQGNDVIVGAANGGFFGEGTAYVFSGSGAFWQEEGKLSASDAGLSDGFGSTVAIDGDIAVVGAPIHDDQSSIDEGAAYVFERVGGNWEERLKLRASDGASGYEFGRAVDIVGNEIAVGAGGANNQAGAIYIFSRSGDVWFETNMLTASDNESGDAFGSALAFTGQYIIVGAPDDRNINGENAGSVYLFSRAGVTWNQQSQLLAASRLVQPGFGASVAIDGDYAVVGAEGDAEATGAAYVYKRTGENWTQQTELAVSDGGNGNRFGRSVAISGDYIVVGAPGADNERGTDAGAAYVFLRGSETWSEQARLIGNDGGANDAFGAAVAIDGDYILVGSPQNDNANGNAAGAAYVYQRNGAAWNQQIKLTAADGAEGDRFGTSLAIQHTTVVVGSPNESALQSGALYVFERDGVVWNEEQKMTAAVPESGASLGNDVDLDESFIIAGAQNIGAARGAVYVFQRTAGRWQQHEVSVFEAVDGVSGDGFGGDVSLSGDLAMVGSSGAAGGRGAAYLFQRDGSNWLQQTRLNPMDEGGSDGFGLATALSGDHAVIGALFDDNGNGPGAGAAYLISLTGSVSIVSTEDPLTDVVAFLLQQNYPNPFIDRTTIPYSLDATQYIRMEIFDVLGRKVATLVDGQMPAGLHEAELDLSDYAGGIYFCRLTGGVDAGETKAVQILQIVRVK